MLARNLLFLGLVLGGLAALGVSLYPPSLPPRAEHFDPAEAQRDDFRAAVAAVDEAVRSRWPGLEVQPAPFSPDLAVVRRASLALTGTVPSLQEVRQLEARTRDWDQIERVQWWLAGLFEDRRYADYVAERLARAYVGTEDGPFLLYRRRRFVTWLSDELLRNRPYDQLVRELIADEGIWTDKPATNFVSVTIEPDKQQGPNPERLAGRVSRAFLGIRLDCAQCHNHPFERDWTQAKFQALAAFFGQTHHGFTGIYDGPGEFEAELHKPGGAKSERRAVAPEVPFLPELLPDAGTRRERLAAWVTDRRNPYFARATANRVWALLFGRPLVDPVDNMGVQEEIPRALEVLADDFSGHGYDLRRLVRVIAATEAFRRDSAAEHEITEVHEQAWAAFPVTRLRPEQVAGSILQAASLETVNQDSHILTKLVRYFNERDFVQRYGDTGEDEFDGRGGTIPQRLLLMNGQLVKERTEGDGLLFSASARIAGLAPDDRTAVETTYLAVLTRRPTPEEAAHFEQRLAGAKGDERRHRLEDLYWTLMNATEFSWNH
jgi:Protein of unknown function (DUF1553)/Protein of unknown function (DUF1549)